MNFANIGKTLTKVAGRSSLVVTKYSPEILLVGGVVGVVLSTVMACKATLSAEDVLDEHALKTEKIAKSWELVERGEISSERYTEKQHQKDLTVVYVQTGVNFVKLYGPAVTLGMASIACIVCSHGIMKKRNVALVAAYKAVEESFSAYRKRVVEEYGEEKDYMFKHNLRAEEVTEAAYTDADGVKHKAEKKTILVPNGENQPSMYARFFDESCQQWTKDPQYNYMFLSATQKYYNQMLQARGHVFLNEVYNALGMPHTPAGAAVGWVLGKDGGDNYIDFGIFDRAGNPQVRAFVNGNERNILLDFNVDGPIWNLI